MHRSPTLRYLDDRERILGRRRWLPMDPSDAAADLVSELGLIEARRWLRDAWQAILREKGDDDGD
jgi:hypothetical protein